MVEFTLHSRLIHINHVPRFPHLCPGSNKACLYELFWWPCMKGSKYKLLSVLDAAFLNLCKLIMQCELLKIENIFLLVTKDSCFTHLPFVIPTETMNMHLCCTIARGFWKSHGSHFKVKWRRHFSPFMFFFF